MIHCQSKIASCAPAESNNYTSPAVSISESTRQYLTIHCASTKIFRSRHRTFINRALTAIELKSHLFISITAISFSSDSISQLSLVKRQKKKKWNTWMPLTAMWHSIRKRRRWNIFGAKRFGTAHVCECLVWVWVGYVGVLVIHIKSVWIKWANDDGAVDRFS